MRMAVGYRQKAEGGRQYPSALRPAPSALECSKRFLVYKRTCFLGIDFVRINLQIKKLSKNNVGISS